MVALGVAVPSICRVPPPANAIEVAYRPAIRDFSGAAADRGRTRRARGGNDLATAEAYDRADRRAAGRNYLQAALHDRRAGG